MIYLTIEGITVSLSFMVVKMDKEKAEKRYKDLVKRIRDIEQNRHNTPVPIALCGTFTLDLAVADHSPDTKKDDDLYEPRLGGTAYFLFKALMSAQSNDFDVKLLGPRSPLNHEDPKPGWQKMFADCVESDSSWKDNWKDKFTELNCKKDFKVPVSIRITKDAGNIRELQTGRNELEWKDYLNFEHINKEHSGLIIIDGIWRFGLYKGLDKVLKELREFGWVIALHPGNFRLKDRSEKKFSSVWNAFKYVDILFGTPPAIARLLGTAESDFANQHVDSIDGFIYTKHVKFWKLPPIVVLNDSKLNFEVIVVHESNILTPKPRSELGTPTGLRSSFMGYFLIEIWRQLVKEASGNGITNTIKKSLKTSLESAYKDPLPSDALGDIEGLFKYLISSVPKEDPQLLEIFGSSKNVREISTVARRHAMTDLNVLIEGETGVGKDIIAKEIHRLSKRSDKKFSAVNCATLACNSELANSALFGHIKGAFTGATKRNVGLIKAADGGTLFLDEIGDMPEDVQAKLLRAIEEKSFRPLGDTKETCADFRLICATNKPLKIREDLLYRLGQRFTIPPLRERKDDIRYIVDGFSKDFSLSFEESALLELERYHWPGNVRELNSLVMFFGMSGFKTVSKDDVGKWIHTQSASSLTNRKVDKSPGSHGRAQKADKKELLSAFVRYLFVQVNQGDLNRYISILYEYLEDPQAKLAPLDFKTKGIDNPEGLLKTLGKKKVLQVQGEGRGAKNILTYTWKSMFQELSELEQSRSS